MFPPTSSVILQQSSVLHLPPGRFQKKRRMAEQEKNIDLDDLDLDDEDVDILLLVCLAAKLEETHRKARERRAAKRARAAVRRAKRRRSLWTREWLVRRPAFGAYKHLMQELQREDRAGFKNYLRMSPELFDEIVERLTPHIEKKDTAMRKAISPAERLAITLRYMATGNSYHSLMYEFRVAHNTISIIVRETCEAIIKEFKMEVLPTPCTNEEWQDVADGFSKRWNFHNCVGAIDGKHVALKRPDHGGSNFFNYKGFHSIVLMAVADSKYKFLYVQVGANGAGADSGVFRETELFGVFDEEVVALPDPVPFPEDDVPIPFHLIGDEAFALRSWMIKPYPHRGLTIQERIFNYRLSRARRVVENAFGILAHRFRCMLTTMQQKPKTVEGIVLACCIMHNLLISRNPADDGDREDPETHAMVDGEWRSDNVLAAMEAQVGNTSTKAGKAQRDYMAEYYNGSIGSVPWQEDKI
jgi:hypothetical protein